MQLSGGTTKPASSEVANCRYPLGMPSDKKRPQLRAFFLFNRIR